MLHYNPEVILSMLDLITESELEVFHYYMEIPEKLMDDEFFSYQNRWKWVMLELFGDFVYDFMNIDVNVNLLKKLLGGNPYRLSTGWLMFLDAFSHPGPHNAVHSVATSSKFALKRLPPKLPRVTMSPPTQTWKKETIPSSEVEPLHENSLEIPLQLANSSSYYQNRDTTDDLASMDISFDPFNCNADGESISAIKSLVDDLNYLVDNAISNILSSFLSEKNRFTFLKFGPVKSGPAVSIGPFYELLLDHDNPDHGGLLDAFMHDEILKFLFNTYFRGNCFQGLEPGAASLLEGLFARIRE
ncbi:hypothetical protein CPB84DRAFT_1748188 [Gymnopilus junonius]|uniref:Uncharacterized protein n=1 Tax=Gymnopilus junonius TaxID=109634 RepID=A0A9P5NJ07_GYMJU|nr:hypothetical protein CPB84DRAFT_1748188 [Gymnopilus junonius]